MAGNKSKSIPIQDPPEESELEKRVDRMLDPELPDIPVESESPELPVLAQKTSKKAIKQTKINVSHTDEAPEIDSNADVQEATAPPLPKSKKSVAVKVEPEAAPTPKKTSSIKVVDRSGEVSDDVAVTDTDLKTTDNADEGVIATAPELDEELKEAIGVTAVEAEAQLTAKEVTKDQEASESPKLTPDTTIEQAEALVDELDTPDVSRAVDQIVAEESDKLLEAQDLEDELINTSDDPAGSRVKRFFADIWASRGFRWAVVLLFLALVGGAAAWPDSRYAILNRAGVRVDASLQVIDQSSLQPLKGVQVRLADKSAKTDDNGKVVLSGLKLGPTLLSIDKPAFAPITEEVVLGWGSNPLDSKSITPVGSQYTFLITDFLSGKPITDAKANAGDADARADDKGLIKLTLDHNQTGKTLDVSIDAPDYRGEKVTLDLQSKQQISVKMAPSRKVVFVSKRSGKYDVYKVDADGKNEQLLLAGTGSEREDMLLAPHPKDEIVALVSTRDGHRNKDGYMLSSLFMIDVKTGTLRKVTESEQISLVGWSGDKLVYVQIAAGTSAANANRQRLMSYDYKQSDNKQLASTNYFNDVMVAGGKVYFAPSSTYQAPGVVTALYRINPDGGGKQALIAAETWNIFRSNYEQLTFSTPSQWYAYNLKDPAPTKLDGAPANQSSRVYVDSPDGKMSLWVDNRDGKGVLIAYDIDKKTEKTLQTKSGLKQPVHWLNNTTLVYRVSTDQETADYALSLQGGEPVKIRDVTATGGVDKWYYY